MTKPSINPKLFEGQRICSLKHDDYLILLKKDSDYLKNVIKQCLKTVVDKYFCEDVIIWINEGKSSSCALKSYLETDKGKLVKNYSEMKAPLILTPLYNSIKIESWNPEKTIKNKGYYIGSIDLFVSISISYKKGLLIDEKQSWVWDHPEWGKREEYKEFIFEFKPKINSYSEVIRQIKVYSSYLGKNIIPICITESDTNKFKEIFESQGIYLFNIKEFEKQTNKV